MEIKINGRKATEDELLILVNTNKLLMSDVASIINNGLVTIDNIYNRENETYNFLKRNVQFSLFFHPIKAKAFNHHLSGN